MCAMTSERLARLLADPDIHAILWGYLPGKGDTLGWLGRGAAFTAPVVMDRALSLLPTPSPRKRPRRVTVDRRPLPFIPVEGIDAQTWVPAGAATPWSAAGTPSTAGRSTITAVAQTPDGGGWLLLSGHGSLPQGTGTPAFSWRPGGAPAASRVSEGEDTAELLGAELNGVVDVGWARSTSPCDPTHPVVRGPPPYRTASPPAPGATVWIQSRIAPGPRQGTVVAGPHPETGLSGAEVRVFGSTVVYAGVFAIKGVAGPFSRRGDSGSLVFVDTPAGPRACGTIVAGDREGSPEAWSYALPVRPILSVLGPTLYNLFFSDT